MPFTKKFPKSGKTKHIRVPEIYSDLILDLVEVFDNRFEPERGTYFLRKYINSLR